MKRMLVWNSSGELIASWASAKKMANFLALIKESDKSHAGGYLTL